MVKKCVETLDLFLQNLADISMMFLYRLLTDQRLKHLFYKLPFS